MPDRESAITHLMIISTWASFARERDLQFFTAKHLESMEMWADEAIALLKEQEAVIRCKDCKYAHKTYDGDCKYCDMFTDDDGNPIERYRSGDWFCADGERR